MVAFVACAGACGGETADPAATGGGGGAGGGDAARDNESEGGQGAGGTTGDAAREGTVGDSSSMQDGTAPTDAGTSADASAGDASPIFEPKFMIGADITWTQQDVAGGAQYVDNGTQKPILELLGGHGFNYVRLRTFVDPTHSVPAPGGGTEAPYSTEGFGDITHTAAFAKQIKDAGMGLLLDFHYSDTWADPGQQVKPAAWAADDLPAAVKHLHDYTLASIQTLIAAGGRPDMVQLGNETTPGILTSPGTPLGPNSNAGWPQLAQLFKAGAAAVHEADPNIKVMLHLDRGGDLGASTYFLDHAIANNVPFDVFGESCYVAYQGGPAKCQATLEALVDKYPQLKFVLAEYNADPADRTNDELRQANDIVFNLKNHQGLGAFFWEPTRNPNGQNPGIFTVNGKTYTAAPACLSQYDQMKVDYGL